MAMTMLLVHCVVLLAAAGSVLSRNAGPVANTPEVCNMISPRESSHGGGPQTGNGGYVIATNLPLDTNAGVYNYSAGVTYNVQVRHMDLTMPLRGFLVRAEDPSGMPMGTFVVNGQNQQLIDCSTQSIPAGTTIGHRNSPGDFLQQTFQWTAPSGSDGFVNFMFAVVQVRVTYYANQNAAQVASNLEAVPAIRVDGTMAPAATGTLPASVTEPDRNPEDYRITMRFPNDCELRECDIFVGIDTNEGDSEWLDVYMEANADRWVAVGFSDSDNMFEADVIGCNINPTTGMVEVLDTWNPASPRTNEGEDDQNVAPFPGRVSFEDGRITCSFARNIVGTNIGVDDLSLNEPYFPMFGRVSGDGGRASSFSAHPVSPTGTPMQPGFRVNPATDRMAIGGGPLTVRQQLTRAHGILMLIAWPVLAVTAIFFAAWMRPALPNGEWFQVHRAFMLGSLFVGAVGFLLIFVAQYEQNPPGLISLGSGFGARTAHFVFGIIIMLLHIINPIISIFRCHPGEPNRWIFNLFHGSIIGLGAEILALTNVGIGIAIFSESFSAFGGLSVFYVYLAWIIFFLALIFILFLLFTVLSCTSQDQDRAKLAPSLVKPLIAGGGGTGKQPQGVELAVPDGDKPSEPAEDKPKVPSSDAPMRWAVLVVFGLVTIPFMIVLLVLIAI